MKIKEIFKINLLIASVMVGSLNVMAQKDTTKLKQEVEVSKNYQPSILDVEKINDIPKPTEIKEIIDQSTLKIVFKLYP